MKHSSFPIYHASEPDTLLQQLLYSDRRVLLLGQPAIGKTTLTSKLAEMIFHMGRSIWAIGADPGSPAFGVPGAVCLGQRRHDGWSLHAMEGLCTLDAARFRLPLVSAVASLVTQITEGTLLLDAPGVIRGVAGAELVTSLAQTADINLVLLLLRQDQPVPLLAELQEIGVTVVSVHAADKARRPGKMTRARHRTQLWDRYLEDADQIKLDFDEFSSVGMPPRRAPEAWIGKQIAFLQHEHTTSMGEVMDADDTALWIRLPKGQLPTHHLLLRDACRDSEGLLTTGKPFAERIVRYIPPQDLLPDNSIPLNDGVRPLVHVGTAMATLVNGVFGDPLLHLRLRHQRRSLLFDLGDGGRLPARIAHQVSDVFITHAHIDHISGFLWLLRSRIGESSCCRLYGPPGLSGHITGLIQGIHWDRIGKRGPIFEVVELHDDRVKKHHIQAGRPGPQWLAEEKIQDGLLLIEPGFCVRAITLDHGIPVLAFAYEPSKQINVRKERLIEQQLEPGPWLNELKTCLLAGESEACITLPNGSKQTVDQLAEELILESKGEKLVYATDFADTSANRLNLQLLAKETHTFFCEATFLQRDREQAKKTGHLTTHACGEIAKQARVQHLIPFHFSRRYEENPQQIYQEISEVCPQVVMPKQMN